MLSEKVRLGSNEIKALEAQIDELVVGLIARRQPMAEDLRHVVSALKITTNIERFADHSKMMVVRVPALVRGDPLNSATKPFVRMAKTLATMMQDAL